MSDVVFLSHGDWANVGSHLAESLRRVGVDAVSWAGWHLKMDMPIKSNIYTKWEETYPDIEEAKVVWMMHGNIFKYRHTPIKSSQLICSFHGGPPLLQVGGKRSTVSQAFFGRFTRRDLHPVHFIQNPRMYDNCYFLEKRYLLGLPVDIDRLIPMYYEGGRKPVVGHFPRNTGTGLITKGYDKVLAALKFYKNTFPYAVSTDFINWIPHIERVNHCDIYVEKLSEIIREWGMTALEAAGLGKIVIAQFDNRETYEKEYGPSPMLTANTDEELRGVLKQLSTWAGDSIQRKQMETRQFVKKHHSFEAVGKRLKGILIKEGAKI